MNWVINILWNSLLPVHRLLKLMLLNINRTITSSLQWSLIPVMVLSLRNMHSDMPSANATHFDHTVHLCPVIRWCNITWFFLQYCRNQSWISEFNSKRHHINHLRGRAMGVSYDDTGNCWPRYDDPALYTAPMAPFGSFKSLFFFPRLSNVNKRTH